MFLLQEERKHLDRKKSADIYKQQRKGKVMGKNGSEQLLCQNKIEVTFHLPALVELTELIILTHLM